VNAVVMCCELGNETCSVYSCRCVLVISTLVWPLGVYPRPSLGVPTLVWPCGGYSCVCANVGVDLILQRWAAGVVAEEVYNGHLHVRVYLQRCE
jgi:hypothetical protein